jgi:hypothetical protein
MSVTTLVTIAAGACLLTATTSAQRLREVHPGTGGSPHVRATWQIDGATIDIEYGRVKLKGRVSGRTVEPYEGQEWRTGADEATTLTTDAPLMIGGLELAAGRYSLYTLPRNGAWQLIVSTASGQWGIPYPAGQDLGRVPMSTRKRLPATEQLTFSVEDTEAGGLLIIDWDEVRASVPFVVLQAK